MAELTTPPLPSGEAIARVFGRVRLIVLLSLFALLVTCLIFAWTTRDSMAHLSFLQGPGTTTTQSESQKTLVDLRPWQVAQALAPLAVTAEETEYAQEAERLADHEVDQAFASAIRLANAQVQHRALTGDALALSQKVTQLQELVKEDQVLVDSLSPKATPAAKNGPATAPNADDLEIAKAQLGLDADELADAQQDLARASGDNRTEIQSELAAHEASMRAYDNKSQSKGQIAVLSVKQYGTLAGRIKAWNSQRSRYQLIQQATQQAQADISALTDAHNSLEAKANAPATASANAPSDHASKLAVISERREQRQLLSIYDDRILTERQLATVYSKWSAQVMRQHRIVLHLILQSLALVVFILICVILCDMLVQHLTQHPSLDRSRLQTLRAVLKLGLQIFGLLLILLVVFGSPKQLSTIVGLATAGITIALQDFILAFIGWFVLMGKKGMRIGDWVEINGVSGEVTEIGLISTTLLETGTSTDTGHPTGRRITFMNSFAIRGQYFNFSTTGQWMWDEITVPLPASNDTPAMVEGISQAVLEETKGDTQLAEQEWKRGARDDGLSKFSATPAVNMRPSGSGIDIQVRYVTRAPSRIEVRNRIYRRVIELMRRNGSQAEPEPGPGVGKA
jgi:small-conductance mechanosensitive channel